MSIKYAEEFNGIVEKAKAAKTPMRAVLAGADTENILRGVLAAQEDGFVDPILVGNYKKIKETLEKIGMTDRKFDIQPVSSDMNVVQYSIEMIRAGSADALVRGNTQTRDFLLPVLNKTNHLLQDKALLTHIVILKVPGYEKLLALSDVTLILEPSQEDRVKIIQNMCKALKVFGIDRPAIALLNLVEKPTFHMTSTVENATIVMNHKREPIADCDLVGPISYDLIMNPEAARLKHYDCPYTGKFDGIVVPNLLSGNLIVKTLETHVGAGGCGVLIGAKIPVAISGRSQGPQDSYLSLAACTAMLNSENKAYYYGE